MFVWTTAGAAGTTGAAGSSAGAGGAAGSAAGAGGAAGSTGGTGTGGTGTGGTGTGGTGTGGATGGSGGAGGVIGCGDGVRQDGELCDGSDLQSATCSLLGYTGGSLTCSSSCQFNISSCTGGTITPTVVASRTSCKAPCGVFFDATSTTGLSGSNYWRANWAWDFNDPTSTSDLGAIGFNVAHVYDNPGTYHVVTRVHDLAGNAGSTTTTITVSAMSGTTFYIASSGSDANPGTQLLPWLTPAKAISSGYATNNTVLFRRGDTFSLNATAGGFMSTNGPFLWSAYTDPGHVSTADPIFTLGNVTSTAINVAGDNLMFQHMHMVAVSPGPVDAWFDVTGSYDLIEYTEMEQAGSASSGCQNVHLDGAAGKTGAFVFGNYLHDFTGYGMFGGNGNTTGNHAIWGNTILNFTGPTGSPLHGVRENACSDNSGHCLVGFYLANNKIIVGPTGQIFTAFTIHGDIKNTVIVGNTVDHDCGIGPTNTGLVEDPNTALIEGNVMQWPASSTGYIALEVDAPHVEIRNNLIVNPDTGIEIGGRVFNLLPPNFIDDVWVENNTEYQNPPSGANLSYAVFFATHENTTGAATFLNNVFVFGMTATSSVLVGIDGAGTETIDYNDMFGTRATASSPGVGTHGITTDPKFASPPADSTMSITPSMFFLQTSSPAKDTGTNTRAYEDFYRVVRPVNSTWDMGAFERLP